MPSKSTTQFVCSNCGFAAPRWQGKCPQCNEWNTFAEQRPLVARKGAGGGGVGKIERLGEVAGHTFSRMSSGMSEFDAVLGGGLVPGALVLIGGDPGVGKSTLALQTALTLTERGSEVLYVSGEESAQQIQLRSSRMSAQADLAVLAETSLEVILDTLAQIRPAVAVIDSIQTMSSSEVNGVVGGVSQVAFATNALMRLAKALHITVLVIGHVTKEGMLAGPKTLEHMVDTVLYLEGERFTSLRLLRCNKNRFGSTGEVGVFDMTEHGLTEVKNPGALFLEHRTTRVAGTCVTALLEGQKVLLLEVQALTNPTSFGYPKRAASGFDTNRLQLLLAIMEKRLGVKVSAQDVYVNVAGGFTLTERAADLPVVLAILSSIYNTPLPEDLLAFGEVGLAGEVRGVIQADKRVKEAKKLGFDQIISAPHKDKKVAAGVRAVNFLTELIQLFPEQAKI